MLKKTKTFLLFAFWFIFFLLVAVIFSATIESTEDIKPIITTIRIIMEITFIGTPLYLAKKIKEESGRGSFKPKDMYKLTILLAVIVIAVEVSIALT